MKNSRIVEKRRLERSRLHISKENDVTESKPAEQRLLESQALLTSIIDSQTDMIWSVDAETLRLLTYNQAFIDYFGKSLGVHVKKGMLPEDLLPTKELSNKWHEFYRRALSEASHTIEYNMQTSDRTLQLSFNQVRRGRKLIGISVFAKDITERRKAEEEVRESEERYRLVFDKSPVGIGLATLEGKVISTNESMQAITGYSAEELGHINLIDTYENQDERHRLLERLKRDGAVTNYPTRLKRKDGTTYDALLSVALVRVGGRDLVQTICIDVTERKEMEEALRRRAGELTALHETVLGITSAKGEWSDLLEAIVARAAKLLDAPCGGLYLCDPVKHEVTCVVSYNTAPHDFRGTVLKYGDGAAGEVAETGQPIIIDDYRKWAGRSQVYEKEKPFGAILAVPLIWQGQVTGVIDVLDKTAVRRFTKEDMELLNLFASHAAIAVENQRYSKSLQDLVNEKTAKLAESERRFRELVDLLPQIVFETDDKGNFTFANRAGLAATGYTQEDLVRGLNALQLFAPKDHPAVEDRISRILSGEQSQGNEYTVIRKDGSPFPVIMHIAPVMHGSGVVGLRGTAVDITERKRDEEALRESEEKYRTLVESATDFIYLIDTKLNILSVNASAAKFLGKPKEEIQGKSISDVFPKEVAADFAKGLSDIFEKGEVRSTEGSLVAQGQEIWTSIILTPVKDHEGKVLAVLGMTRDITYRKRLEAELAESQRLVAIGQTAAMVGHDLRNPLQAIATTVHLMRKQTEDSPNDQKLSDRYGSPDMLNTIEEAVSYMDKIVSDLQTFSEPRILQLKRLDLGQLLKESVSMARVPSNIQVSLSVAENFMLADPVIERVFINLITNSVQAMPNGGQLTIGTSAQGGEVLIRFQDTGVGIPKEYIPKLFDPLFTTKAKGQGLGLSVCKRLVDAHQGSVSVESTVNKGSTFTVRLPRR